MDKAAALMAGLRKAAPGVIGGVTVSSVHDYKLRKAFDLSTGAENEILLPSSNVLEYILGDKGSVIVRPSGTEPKVKFYYTAVGDTETDASQLLDCLQSQMTSAL